MAVRSILRLAGVEAATGLKKSAIYAEMAKGEFPRPVRISRQAVGWFQDEIEQWQAERQRAQGGWRPGQPRPASEAA